MDRLGPHLLRHLDDLRDRQVALGRRRRPQQVRLVGVPDVRGVAVRLRVHGDGGDPHLAQGPHDPDRDLTPVRDQDLLEHHKLTFARGPEYLLPAASSP